MDLEGFDNLGSIPAVIFVFVLVVDVAVIGDAGDDSVVVDNSMVVGVSNELGDDALVMEDLWVVDDMIA